MAVFYLPAIPLSIVFSSYRKRKTKIYTAQLYVHSDVKKIGNGYFLAHIFKDFAMRILLCVYFTDKFC